MRTRRGIKNPTETTKKKTSINQKKTKKTKKKQSSDAGI